MILAGMLSKRFALHDSNVFLELKRASGINFFALSAFSLCKVDVSSFTLSCIVALSFARVWMVLTNVFAVEILVLYHCLNGPAVPFFSIEILCTKIVMCSTKSISSIISSKSSMKQTWFISLLVMIS